VTTGANTREPEHTTRSTSTTPLRCYAETLPLSREPDRTEAHPLSDRFRHKAIARSRKPRTIPSGAEQKRGARL